MHVEVHDLDYSYGSTQVLSGVDFHVRTGDCLALLGENGTGKTTLLKCLLGILKSEQAIRIDGILVESLTPKALSGMVSYVAQDILCGEGTVFDTVLLGRKPYMDGKPTKEDLLKVERTLETLGLSSHALKSVSCLSGGERQKVLIARALAQETPLIIMDEPTSSLDLKNQLEITECIRALFEREGRTLIVCMHDINLAMRFCNKFLFLREGKVRATGDADIITPSLIRDVYGVTADILVHHHTKKVLY